MSKNKPFEVDKLLDKVPGKYALALLLGRRAVQIKRADRDEMYPLQRAYEEVVRGEVGITFEAPDKITDPLSLDALVLEEEAPSESPIESPSQQSEGPLEGFSVEIGGDDEAESPRRKAASPLDILTGALRADDSDDDSDEDEEPDEEDLEEDHDDSEDSEEEE